MARPQKDGLDYFPLDVDMDQDDKVALIEAQHGITGFAVIVKLLMKIYKNGYFYEWTEKEQLLFSKRINVDINSINVIINDCVKWDLFDGDMLSTYKILTSKGIQSRYLKATDRRQKVEIDRRYLLLDAEQVNACKNLIIVDINTNSEDVNDNINPQSKVKESKVKESKVKNTDSDNEVEIDIHQKALELCKYYEELKPMQSITKDLATLKIFLEDYEFDWCKEALQKTVIGTGKFVPNYMGKILQDWAANGKPEKKGAEGDGSTEQDNGSSPYDFSKFGG